MAKHIHSKTSSSVAAEEEGFEVVAAKTCHMSYDDDPEMPTDAADQSNGDDNFAASTANNYGRKDGGMMKRWSIGVTATAFLLTIVVTLAVIKQPSNNTSVTAAAKSVANNILLAECCVNTATNTCHTTDKCNNKEKECQKCNKKTSDVYAWMLPGGGVPPEPREPDIASSSSECCVNTATNTCHVTDKCNKKEKECQKCNKKTSDVYAWMLPGGGVPPEPREPDIVGGGTTENPCCTIIDTNTCHEDNKCNEKQRNCENKKCQKSGAAVWQVPGTTLTSDPTSSPTTAAPSKAPTNDPTSSPTKQPSKAPTTSDPIPSPTTAAPSKAPTPQPSNSPTPSPTPQPVSPAPTSPPTLAPTSPPTPQPTSSAPTPLPTPLPTNKPTTKAPTPVPTHQPSPNPTPLPTNPVPATPAPTAAPTATSTTVDNDPTVYEYTDTGESCSIGGGNNFQGPTPLADKSNVVVEFWAWGDSPYDFMVDTCLDENGDPSTCKDCAQKNSEIDKIPWPNTCTFEGDDFKCVKDSIIPFMNRKMNAGDGAFQVHLGDILKGTNSAANSRRCTTASFDSRAKLFGPAKNFLLINGDNESNECMGYDITKPSDPIRKMWRDRFGKYAFTSDFPGGGRPTVSRVEDNGEIFGFQYKNVAFFGLDNPDGDAYLTTNAPVDLNAKFVKETLASDENCELKSIVIFTHVAPEKAVDEELDDYFKRCGVLPILTAVGNAHPKTYCLTKKDERLTLTVEAFQSGPVLVSILRDPNKDGGDYFHVADSDLKDSNSDCPNFTS